MNNTKWREIQKAMYELQESPKWRTCTTADNYISNWDAEWFYHFSEGGFKDIEWLEIKAENERASKSILSLLKSIHVPGIKTESGFKIYGYINEGQSIDYL